MLSCVVNPSVGDEVGKKLWAISWARSRQATYHYAQSIRHNRRNLVMLNAQLHTMINQTDFASQRFSKKSGAKLQAM
jgi:hypothetical protein